jgi:hypothetical protein
MVGKMGPLQQVVPIIPNLKNDRCNKDFYCFNDLNGENKPISNKHENSDKEGSKSNQDSDGKEDAAILENNPSL